MEEPLNLNELLRTLYAIKKRRERMAIDDHFGEEPTTAGGNVIINQGWRPLTPEERAEMQERLISNYWGPIQRKPKPKDDLVGSEEDHFL